MQLSITSGGSLIENLLGRLNPKHSAGGPRAKHLGGDTFRGARYDFHVKSPALSFWQPYAWLICSGHAEVDSRLWAPSEKYVGQRIFIHASKRKITKAEFADFLRTMKKLKIKNFPASPEDFDYGAVVGSAVIDGVRKNSKSSFAFPGYFHWCFSGAKLMKPVPTKGYRNWFSFQG